MSKRWMSNVLSFLSRSAHGCNGKEPASAEISFSFCLRARGSRLEFLVRKRHTSKLLWSWGQPDCVPAFCSYLGEKKANLHICPNNGILCWLKVCLYSPFFPFFISRRRARVHPPVREMQRNLFLEVTCKIVCQGLCTDRMCLRDESHLAKCFAQFAAGKVSNPGPVRAKIFYPVRVLHCCRVLRWSSLCRVEKIIVSMIDVVYWLT